MTNPALSFALVLLLASCFSSGHIVPPPDVVPHVDLTRYAGRWFEIASFPQSFQKGCSNTQAVYTLRNDGTMEVKNSCYRNGKVDTATGKAWVMDGASNAKLKVSFFWPFRGDYWIIGLGRNYEYAVVSAPSKKYLWILSREPRMNAKDYENIIVSLKNRGFDVGQLQQTVQGALP